MRSYQNKMKEPGTRSNKDERWFLRWFQLNNNNKYIVPVKSSGRKYWKSLMEDRNIFINLSCQQSSLDWNIPVTINSHFGLQYISNQILCWWWWQIWTFMFHIEKVAGNRAGNKRIKSGRTGQFHPATWIEEFRRRRTKWGTLFGGRKGMKDHFPHTWWEGTEREIMEGGLEYSSASDPICDC